MIILVAFIHITTVFSNVFLEKHKVFYSECQSLGKADIEIKEKCITPILVFIYFVIFSSSQEQADLII